MMTTLRSHKRWAAVLAVAATVGTLVALAVLGVFSGSASALDLPPVAQKMHAFSAPPLQQAALPANVRNALDRIPDPQGHGAAILGEVRLLRANLGANHVGLYAVPTTGGAVCYLLNEKPDVGGCASEFPPTYGNLIITLYFAEGTPFTVAGLAPDDVTGVTVVANGQAREASLKNNVFFWQSDTDTITRESLDELRVQHADGSSTTVDTP